ncbi:hypothetical protein [Oerskovia flava]|uniref:hypothetical protein n=1 Tax=Oerskovia flava TaxID=2986422 RepID=UPI00223FFDE1|nr:hypothetical protein [Oerskovia sp. JB1-3-2]
MDSSVWRPVARGVVLAAVAVTTAVVVVSGAFDQARPVVSFPVAAPPPGGGGTPGDEPGTPAEGGTPDTCADAETAWAAANKAQVSLSVAHPGALVEGFVAARDALVSTTPPAEIAADWHLVAGYLTMIADAVEEVGPEDPDGLVRAIDRAGAMMDVELMTQSSASVTAYLRDSCGR